MIETTVLRAGGDSREGTPPPGECIHRWRLDEPGGPRSAGRCRHCGVEREFGNSEEAVVELSPKRTPHYQGRALMQHRPMGKWPQGDKHQIPLMPCSLCGKPYRRGAPMSVHRTVTHGVRSR